MTVLDPRLSAREDPSPNRHSFVRQEATSSERVRRQGEGRRASPGSFPGQHFISGYQRRSCL